MYNYLIKAMVGLFAVACVALIPISVVYGELGVKYLTLLLLYPSLIVLFASIAVVDVFMLTKHFQNNGMTKENIAGIVFLAGRGVCFSFAAYVFIKMEYKLILTTI